MKTIQMNQFAAMNLIYSRASLEDFLDSVCRIGMKNVEIWTQLQFFCEYYKSTSNAMQLRKELQVRNLNLVCFIPEQCTWPYNIASSDPEIRKKSCDYYIRGLEFAKELGSSKVLLTPGWYEWDLKQEDGFCYSVDSLHKILPYFHEAGVVPVLEILQPQESNLMYDLKTVKRYADHFSAEELSFCIDTVPVALAGEKLSDYFELLHTRIRHLHFVDGIPTGHMVLGDGKNDLLENIKAIQKNDYTQYITLEFGQSIYYKSPEFHMERGLKHLKKLLQEAKE